MTRVLVSPFSSDFGLFGGPFPYNAGWTADKSTPVTYRIMARRGQFGAQRSLKKTALALSFDRKTLSHLGLGVLVCKVDGPDTRPSAHVQDASDPGTRVVGGRGAEAVVKGAEEDVVL